MITATMRPRAVMAPNLNARLASSAAAPMATRGPSPAVGRMRIPSVCAHHPRHRLRIARGTPIVLRAIGHCGSSCGSSYLPLSWLVLSNSVGHASSNNGPTSTAKIGRRTIDSGLPTAAAALGQAHSGLWPPVINFPIQSPRRSRTRRQHCKSRYHQELHLAACSKSRGSMGHS